MAVVGLIDYGAGNIHSIANALAHVGAEVRRIGPKSSLGDVTHLVLPGVGAFGYCAERLRGSGLLPALEDWALYKARPILGICVGMQLLADKSEEMGCQEGLGWIGGEVRKLNRSDVGIRVPHVGWNEVRFVEPFGTFGTSEAADFYFDHSFAYVQPRSGIVLGRCTHGETFCAIVRRGNIIGAQFHPEKSQSAGQRFLSAFLQ